MEFLKRMFRKKKAEETLKEERKPDIRREFINGEWREVRHYSEDERLVPMSYANREALRLIKEMRGITKDPEELTKMARFMILENKFKDLLSNTDKKRGKITVRMGIEGSHSKLENYAMRLLLEKGFKIEQIFPEFEVNFKGENYTAKVDMVGINESERVAIECGGLTFPHKLDVLATKFSEVIWIPHVGLPLERQRKGEE